MESDTKLRLEGTAKVVVPSGNELAYLNPPLAFWAHPDRHLIAFDFRRGNIVVKNPDTMTLEKMKLLALRLNARVQGEESEFYDFEDDGKEDELRAI